MGLLKEQFDRAFLSVYHGIYDDYKSYFLSGGIFNVFLLWLEKGGGGNSGECCRQNKGYSCKVGRRTGGKVSWRSFFLVFQGQKSG